MAKPSIFSSDYEKRMRKRKVRKVFTATFMICGLVAIMIFKGSIGENITQKIKTFNIKEYFSEKFKQEDEITPQKIEANKEPVTENKPSEIIEKKYDITLDNEKTIKVFYDESNEGKKIKEIVGDENFYYNLSIDSKKAVVLTEPNKKMFLIDVEGMVKDITKENYTSSSGTVFLREEELKIKPEYIWCQSPKFINEKSIVYISQLPWFNRESKFIWIYNISNNTHLQLHIEDIQSLSFGKFSDKGLMIEMDGKTRYITNEGKIID